jgi:anti-anti-sigma factor
MSATFQDVGADLRRISVSGRLDMEGTDTVGARLMELVEAPKKGVVVDLAAVPFIASVGIRALVASAKAVQKRGGKLAIVVARGSTVAVSLEVTGVDELIPVFTDMTEAAEAVLS